MINDSELYFAHYCVIWADVPGVLWKKSVHSTWMATFAPFWRHRPSFQAGNANPPWPLCTAVPSAWNTLPPVFRPVLLGHTFKETSPATLYKITTRHPSLFLALFNLYRYDIRDVCAYFIPPPLEFEPYKGQGMVSPVHIYIPNA